MIFVVLRATSVLGQSRALDDRFEDDSRFWPLPEPNDRDESIGPNDGIRLAERLRENREKPNRDANISLRLEGHIKLKNIAENEGLFELDSLLLIRNGSRVTLWSREGATLDGESSGRILRVRARERAPLLPLVRSHVATATHACTGGQQRTTSAHQHHGDRRQINFWGWLWAYAGRR